MEKTLNNFLKKLLTQLIDESKKCKIECYNHQVLIFSLYSKKDCDKIISLMQECIYKLKNEE